MIISVVKPSKQHKQSVTSVQRIHPLALCVSCTGIKFCYCSVIAMILISTRQALEELNYTLAWPSRSRQVLQSHMHIQLAM